MTVELRLAQRAQRQVAAEEDGVLDADREVGADEPVVEAQQVLVQRSAFSSGAGMTYVS